MSRRIPGLFITGTDTGVGKTYVAGLIARRLAQEGRKVGVYKPAASGCTRRGGVLVSEDAEALWEAAGRPGDLEHVCPQRFAAPLAPHLAAAAEGRQLDPGLLRRGLEYWQERSEIILVEGAGGLMSPLGERGKGDSPHSCETPATRSRQRGTVPFSPLQEGYEYVADLAAEFGFPLLVVSPNVLGCINQTLQTLIAAAAYRGREKGTVPDQPSVGACRSGPEGAAHKWGQSPFPSAGLAVAGVVLNQPAPPRPDDASLSSNFRELAVRCVPPVLAEVRWGDDSLEGAVEWFSLAR